jgi:hypothetical protein
MIEFSRDSSGVNAGKEQARVILGMVRLAMEKQASKYCFFEV